MPKVSVIIPIYGVEQYIVRCAKSLFSQTLDNIEFIFIDDCSPDKSMTLLEAEIEKNRLRFAKMGWCVRTERMPANSGQAAVRRHGIQLATGDYVIHCDSDDWVEADMYRLMYEKAVSENLDVVCCGYYRSDGNVSKAFKSGFEDLPDKDAYFKRLLTYRAITSVWSKLVKRSLYTDNEINYPTNNMWEDFALNVQLFFYANSAGVVDKPLYFYYTNIASISYSNIDIMQVQIQQNAELILKFLRSKALDNKYKAQIEFFKYMARTELVVFTKNRKYLNLWRNTFPEINKSFWYNSEFGTKDKLKFLLIYTGIYSYFYL